MNIIDNLTISEKIKSKKELNSMSLDEAIEKYIRMYEDKRDRGISKNAMRDLVNDLVNLFWKKYPDN